MKNEDKIVEPLAEMVKGQDRLIGEVSSMKSEISEMNTEISEMKSEISEMNTEISQMNIEIRKQGLQTAENSRAMLKLVNETRLVAEHEKRISKLELTVFK